MNSRDLISLFVGTFLIFFVFGLFVFYEARRNESWLRPGKTAVIKLPSAEAPAAPSSKALDDGPEMSEEYFASPCGNYRISVNLLPYENRSPELYYCEVFLENTKFKTMQLIDDFTIWENGIKVKFSPSGSHFALNISESAKSENFKIYEVSDCKATELPVAFPELSKDLKYGNLDDCQVYVVKWLSDKSFAVNCKIWGGTISKKPVFSKDYIYTIGEGYQEKE